MGKELPLEATSGKKQSFKAKVRLPLQTKMGVCSKMLNITPNI